MISTKDIIWLSGLLEGEGCFTTYPKNGIGISIAMVDEDIISRIRTIMSPHSKICINTLPNRKTTYRIAVTGDLGAQWMMTLYSLMGRRRKERIRELLKIWKDNIKSRSNALLRSREREAKYQATLVELIKKSTELV